MTRGALSPHSRPAVIKLSPFPPTIFYLSPFPPRGNSFVSIPTQFTTRQITVKLVTLLFKMYEIKKKAWDRFRLDNADTGHSMSRTRLVND